MLRSTASLRATVAVLIVALLAVPAFAGLDSHHALYLGGTLTGGGISVPPGAEGVLDTSGDTAVVFAWQKDRQRGIFEARQPST